MSILELEAPKQATEEAFPYETPVFHQCWWEFLAPKFDIPVKNDDLLIFRKPMLKGLVAMREARISGWNSAWHQDLTLTRLAELDELSQTTGWDYFRMQWNETRREHQALDTLAEKGYLLIERPAPVQYVVDLSNGLDAYLKGLSHNSRKSLKKKTRLAQPLNPTLVPCTEFNEIEPFFAELFQHHITYWDGKVGRSYFNDVEERNFMVNWSKTLHRTGNLRLERMQMNGETVNLSMGIVMGRTFHWLLTVNTGLYNDYAPGIVGLYLRLEAMAAEGIRSFKMGPGDYFYKMQAANQQEACYDLIICNPRSLKGRLYYEWMRRRQAPASTETKTSD